MMFLNVRCAFLPSRVWVGTYMILNSLADLETKIPDMCAYAGEIMRTYVWESGYTLTPAVECL